MLSQPSRCASSCFTCPPQENGDLAGSSSAGGAFLQSFLGNSSQYVGNCWLNCSPPEGQEETEEGAVDKLVGEAEGGECGGKVDAVVYP